VGYNYIGAALNNLSDTASLEEDNIRVWSKLIQTNDSRPGCVFRGPCQSSTRSNDVEPHTLWTCFQRPCQSSTRPNDVDPLTSWMCFQGALSVVNSLRRGRTTHGLDVFSGGPCQWSTRSDEVEPLTACMCFQGALSVVNSLKRCRTTHGLYVFSRGLVSHQLAQTMQNHSRPGCVFKGPCQSSTRSNDVEPLTVWICFQGALLVVNSLK